MTDSSTTARRAPAGRRSYPERFEDYARFVSSLQTVELGEGEAAGFDWQAQLRPLGPATFSHAKVSHHLSRRTPSTCAKVGLDHILVYYRLSGHAELRTDGASRVTSPGDVTFMDLSRPMSSSGPIDTICVGFPRTLVAPLVKDIDGMHGLVLPAGTALGRLAASHLQALSAEIGHMGPAEARIVARATASLLAACTDASPAVCEESRVRARPALLVTIRHHIERHLLDRTLGVETIARHFALSRSTLFRLFHQFGGIEIYIRRRRLARAYQALSGGSALSDDYIYQVAQASGFASASAFSRAFRSEFGHTPRDVARGMGGRRPDGFEIAASTDLSRCLHEMVFEAA